MTTSKPGTDARPSCVRCGRRLLKNERTVNLAYQALRDEVEIEVCHECARRLQRQTGIRVVAR